MSEVQIFKTRHGFKKVVVTAKELSLERSVGPIVFRRRRYRLELIESVHFHSKAGHAADQYGSMQVQVSGFTLTLKDGGRDDWPAISDGSTLTSGGEVINGL